MLGFALSSAMIDFIRSSNCPRYLVPATTLVISSAIIRLLNNVCDTFRSLMRCASPSIIALFPTPGSPINTGLFFFRRLRICARRSISLSLPTTGSNRPSREAFVMSKPKESIAGVSVPVRFFLSIFVYCDVPPSTPLLTGGVSFSSSSSSSKSTLSFDAGVAFKKDVKS